jgi:hypothetical protein
VLKMYALGLMCFFTLLLTAHSSDQGQRMCLRCSRTCPHMSEPEKQCTWIA